MREIKFRAWDKQEQCWLDPEHFYITGRGEPYTCQQGHHNISYRYELLMGTGRYIVERFTGLKDKNGTEGVQGDLIWHSDRNGGEPIEIIWDDGSWKGKYTGSLPGFTFILNQLEMSQTEIISNIHQYQHPKLLEKDDG